MTYRPRARPPSLAHGLLMFALPGVLIGAAASAAHAQGNFWQVLQRGAAGPVEYPPLLRDAAWAVEHDRERDVIVVDARPAAAFAAGHVPDARHVDPATWDGNVESLASWLSQAGVPSVGEAVCVTDRESPAAAGALFWLLELAGHPHVTLLNGGMEAWRAAGGAVSQDGPSAPMARFDAAPDTSRIADYAYLRARFGTPGTSILDWRSPERWAGGHIPHSLPFPLGTLLGAGGLLFDGPGMRAIFAEWGPREREYVSLEDEIIVCGDLGARDAAVHPYFAARLAGIRRVRVYREGFAGWRAHPDAPVVRLIGTDEMRAMLHASWGGTLRDTPPRDFILFDLRGAREYELGHIPGALNLQPHLFEGQVDQFVRDRWPISDRARIPMVFYCYGPTCTRSRNCSTMAARHGYLHLLWYKEGTEGWRAEGEPLVPARP